MNEKKLSKLTLTNARLSARFRLSKTPIEIVYILHDECERRIAKHQERKK